MHSIKIDIIMTQQEKDLMMLEEDIQRCQNKLTYIRDLIDEQRETLQIKLDGARQDRENLLSSEDQEDDFEDRGI